MDTFRVRGKHVGGFRVNIKILWHPPSLSIVVGPGRATLDRTFKKPFTNRSIQHPSRWWDEQFGFSTKIQKQNDRIGNIYRFKRWLDRFELDISLTSGFFLSRSTEALRAFFPAVLVDWSIFSRVLVRGSLCLDVVSSHHPSSLEWPWGRRPPFP